ncbi:hypothetical protein CCACVL1_28997 [Corchorus capsularis]|uniref:Secreted protein n=1 Tax=Corchorus capsularis TaxID=210143 RepID=A0A1R3G4D2_COCAP|nr:hypothetical protein CCACVL1_28997 [Corchorus capsularis]
MGSVTITVCVLALRVSPVVTTNSFRLSIRKGILLWNSFDSLVKELLLFSLRVDLLKLGFLGFVNHATRSVFKAEGLLNRSKTDCLSDGLPRRSKTEILGDSTKLSSSTSSIVMYAAVFL